MKCRKCEQEIKIHGIKGCYWCPDCRLRGPAVNEDEVVESQGGITMSMVRAEIRTQIAAALAPKVPLTGLTGDAEQELVEKGAQVEKERTWREDAKALGIPVYDHENSRPRLKVDVLADIEKARNDITASPQEEDNNKTP